MTVVYNEQYSQLEGFKEAYNDASYEMSVIDFNCQVVGIMQGTYSKFP
jgi:hypothetical protein